MQKNADRRGNGFRQTAFLAVLLYFLFSLFPSPSAASHKNFLWKAQSKTATVYLLGSIHFMTKDAYPLSNTIEGAFAGSNVLAVEADVNNPDQLFFTRFIESAFYQGDETLRQHVSSGTYELVQTEFAKFGLPMEILGREKPWFLALTITSLKLLNLGFDPNYGIDMHFLSRAGQKKVIELESLDYQLGLLSGFTDAEQEAFLVYTIRDLQNFEKESGSLVHAWKEGDVSGVDSMVSRAATDPAMASVYRKLIDKRNRGMAKKIEDFLAAKGTYFVVVGAGHLTGGNGIVGLLRARGYPVEQL